MLRCRPTIRLLAQPQQQLNQRTISTIASGWSSRNRSALQLPLCSQQRFLLHSSAARSHRHRSHAHLHEHEEEHEHEHEHRPATRAPTAAAKTSSRPLSSTSSIDKQAAASSSPAEQPLSTTTMLFRRLKGVLHHYTLGAKLLWKNYKIARQLKKRVKNDGIGALSYPEHVFLRRWRSDFAVGVPFILVFSLPVVGYAAPLFALFAPRYIPATFHTPAQVLTHVRLDARAARSSIASLKQFYGFHAHACGLDKLRRLLERIERGVGRVQHVDELLPLSRLFAALSPTLLSFPRQHLLLLHRTLLHAGFLPRYFFTRGMFVRALTRWRERVWAEDKLLLRPEGGGVDALTTEQLVRALYDRGLYRQPIAMGAVLAREQANELDSVDSSKQKKPGSADTTSTATPSSSADASSLLSSFSSRTAFDPPLLPPPPSDALVSEWRQTLREWLSLHARLVDETNVAQQNFQLKTRQEDADRIAALIERTPADNAAQADEATADAQQLSTKPAENAAPLAASSSPVPPPSGTSAAVPSPPAVPAAPSSGSASGDARPAVTSSSSSSSPSSSAPAPVDPMPPAFPLVFLVHVGPLARIISTAADLAAVQPDAS
jgi:hypothetical protein